MYVIEINSKGIQKLLIDFLLIKYYLGNKVI